MKLNTQTLNKWKTFAEKQNNKLPWFFEHPAFELRSDELLQLTGSLKIDVKTPSLKIPKANIQIYGCISVEDNLSLLKIIMPTITICDSTPDLDLLCFALKTTHRVNVTQNLISFGINNTTISLDRLTQCTLDLINGLEKALSFTHLLKSSARQLALSLNGQGSPSEKYRIFCDLIFDIRVRYLTKSLEHLISSPTCIIEDEDNVQQLKQLSGVQSP